MFTLKDTALKQTVLIVALLFWVWACPLAGQAQDDSFEYDRETVYGLNLNTNAGLLGGLAVKHARRIDAKRYHSFGLEIVNVKDAKEVRVANRINNNSFLAYKLNYLFAVRPNYGQELILFRKAPDDGVHLNLVVAGGPSIGLLKPYYILYDEVFNNDPNRAVSVPYDPQKHTSLSNIYGAGSFFDGFDRLKPIWGAHLKTALYFEFGVSNTSVVGIESGFMFERYNQKVPLVYQVNNRQFFSSAFITFYYGSKR